MTPSPRRGGFPPSEEEHEGDGGATDASAHGRTGVEDSSGSDGQLRGLGARSGARRTTRLHSLGGFGLLEGAVPALRPLGNTLSRETARVA